MPELPEVETIRRGLENFVIGKAIRRVEVRCEKSFIGPQELVQGAQITAVRRRGKALLIDLSNEITMMIHLRMTGQLIYRDSGFSPHAGGDTIGREDLRLMTSQSFAGGHPTDSFYTEMPNKQTRVIFKLTSGTLYFNDQRKFGFVKILPTAEVEQDKFIASLAPEPWQTQPADFHAKLQRRKGSPIKAVILDQKVIAGIGNIYADEALYYAQIHPSQPAGSLSLAQATLLIEGACQVMDASINSGGSTMATYVRADGTKGDYLEKFAQVFRREGQPCARCGAEIIKIRVAGRGTHICPQCQRVVGANAAEDNTADFDQAQAGSTNPSTAAEPSNV